jgi:transcriptional regulator with XRE-family HTH domain
MSRNDANIIRLKALVELLDLSLTDIARIAGCSRPLISRILNKGIDGDSIWAALERGCRN